MLQKSLQSAMAFRYENKLVSTHFRLKTVYFFGVFLIKILLLYKFDIIININPKICLNINSKSFYQVHSS